MSVSVLLLALCVLSPSQSQLFLVSLHPLFLTKVSYKVRTRYCSSVEQHYLSTSLKRRLYHSQVLYVGYNVLMSDRKSVQVTFMANLNSLEKTLCSPGKTQQARLPLAEPEVSLGNDKVGGSYQMRVSTALNQEGFKHRHHLTFRLSNREGILICNLNSTPIYLANFLFPSSSTFKKNLVLMVNRPNVGWNNE